MLVKLHAIMWLQGMFSKLGFPILATYCGANFVPWWLRGFWYFLIDLIPGSSLALDCYATYVWHFFFSLIFYWDRTSGKTYVYICGWCIDIRDLTHTQKEKKKPTSPTAALLPFNCDCWVILCVDSNKIQGCKSFWTLLERKKMVCLFYFWNSSMNSTRQ